MRPKTSGLLAAAALIAAGVAFFALRRAPGPGAPLVTPEPPASLTPSPAPSALSAVPRLAPAPSAPPDSPFRHLTPAGTDLCARALEHNRALVERSTDAHRRDVDRSPPWNTEWCAKATVAPGDQGDCASSGGLAWAKVLEEVVVCPRDITWRLVAITPGKAVAFDDAFRESQEFRQSSALSLHDLDGDGRPEAVFEVDREHPEGPTWHDLEAYTFKDGVVRAFDLGGIGVLRDVDEDGRLDGLIRYGGDDVKLSCMGWRYWSTPEVTLLKHGQEGGFTMTDEAARAHARGVCPERPAKIVAQDGGGNVDDDATFRAVVCARVWGTPVKTIEAAVARACKPWQRDDCDGPADKKAPGECWDPDTFARVAEAVPVILGASPLPGPMQGRFAALATAPSRQREKFCARNERRPGFRADPSGPARRAPAPGRAPVGRPMPLPGLETLSISDTASVSDLTGIATLTSLRELDLRGLTVTDLSPLAGLARLERLSISHCRELRDLRPLAGLSLRRLDLVDCNPALDATVLPPNCTLYRA